MLVICLRLSLNQPESSLTLLAILLPLVDHIYTNIPQCCTKPVSRLVAFRDHNIIAITRKTKIPKCKVNIVHKRMFKKFIPKRFLADVGDIDWTDVYAAEEPEASLNICRRWSPLAGHHIWAVNDWLLGLSCRHPVPGHQELLQTTGNQGCLKEHLVYGLGWCLWSSQQPQSLPGPGRSENTPPRRWKWVGWSLGQETREKVAPIKTLPRLDGPDLFSEAQGKWLGSDQAFQNR